MLWALLPVQTQSCVLDPFEMEVAWRHVANPHASQNTGKDTPLQAPWSLLKSLHLRRFASHWNSQSSFVLVQRCWLTCVSPPNWFQVFLLMSSKALAIVRQLARLLGKMCKADLSWTRSHLQRHLVGHLVKVNSCLIVVNFLGDEKSFAPRLWLAGPSCLNVNISCYYLQAQRDRSQFLSFLLIGATQESSCSSSAAAVLPSPACQNTLMRSTSAAVGNPPARKIESIVNAKVHLAKDEHLLEVFVLPSFRWVLLNRVNKTILRYISFFGFSQLSSCEWKSCKASGWLVLFVWYFLLLKRAVALTGLPFRTKAM